MLRIEIEESPVNHGWLRPVIHRWRAAMLNDIRMFVDYPTDEEVWALRITCRDGCFGDVRKEICIPPGSNIRLRNAVA